MQYKIRLIPRYKISGLGTKVWPPIYPDQKLIDELKRWCKETIGTNGWNYYGMYRKIPFEFRFKRSEDLLAFKLTFGLW
ncbi:MAG TPA: hypothetical protein VIY47_05995 [Ignavibacteriaceae bacterium]